MAELNIRDLWEQKATDYLAKEASTDRIERALVDAVEVKSPVATIRTTQLCRVIGTKAFEEFQQATKKEYPQIVTIEQQGHDRIRLWTKQPNILTRALNWL